MNLNYRRSYRGPIEAVLLDWAGTTMDFGCMAPAVVDLRSRGIKICSTTGYLTEMMKINQEAVFRSTVFDCRVLSNTVWNFSSPST
jgi:hypothetical protein